MNLRAFFRTQWPPFFDCISIELLELYGSIECGLPPELLAELLRGTFWSRSKGVEFNLSLAESCNSKTHLGELPSGEVIRRYVAHFVMTVITFPLIGGSPNWLQRLYMVGSLPPYQLGWACVATE